MEKIININIGNYTFIIEEPAFNKLKQYLYSLNNHFNETEGKEEIVGDIEIRIGELLHAKITAFKKAVNLADIEEVLNQMGNPADIGEGNTTNQTNDKTDYKNYYSNRRRVFRDPDNKKMGGVCGGVAAYFDIDPIWLRLAFIVSFFVFGTGLLLYIILWAILPVANTAAEKLEMKGEPIDVNNIEKTIKENLNRVKNDFKNYYKTEGEPNLKKRAYVASSFVADMFHQVGFVLLRIIGGSLLFAGLLLLVIWFKAVLFSNSNGFSGFITGLFSSTLEQQLATLSILILIAIPLFGSCIGGFQMLFGVRYKNKPLKYTFNILVFGSIVTLIYLGYVTIENFSTTGSYQQTQPLPIDSTNQVKIVFDVDEHFDNYNKITFNNNSLFYMYNEQTRIGDIKIKIKKSETDSNYILQKFVSRGVNDIEARASAKKINYIYTFDQNKLVLNNYATYKKNDVWRNQHLEFTIYLIEGTEINWNDLPPNVDFIPDFNDDNAQDAYYDDECQHWEMTEKGLQCLNKSKVL